MEQQLSTKTMLEWALELASLGFHVFQVAPNAKFPPLITDYQNRATRDFDLIKEMWTNGHTNSNIGISTTKFGESEALIVIDIDHKPEKGKMGFNEVIRLELSGVDFPPTFETQTPSGGRHLYYRSDKPITQGADVRGHRGIDTRSESGYAVGPGSITKDGVYVPTIREIAKIAPSLLTYLQKPKLQIVKNLPKIEVNPDATRARAIHYLEKEAHLAIQGDAGDQTTFKVACQLKDFGVSESEALELMSEHWNEGCVPPWDFEGLQRKVGNAYEYGKNRQGSSSPEADFPVIKEENPLFLGVGGKKDEKKKTLFGLTVGQCDVDFDKQFLVEDILSPNNMSVIYGPSGAGKTFFALDLALHVALGQPWHGRPVTQGLVVYVAAEGSWGIRKRIRAFRLFHKIESKIDIPFVLIPTGIDLLNPKTHTQELLELMKGYEDQFSQKAGIVVIDTLSCAFGGGNENEARDMVAFTTNIRRLIDKTGAHFSLIHHSGKDIDRGARGHSSLRASTDTEIEVNNLVAKITKQRDCDPAEDIHFRLEKVEIGQSLKGKHIFSQVPLPVNTSAIKDFSKKPVDPSSLEGKCLQALQNALNFHGQPAPDDLELYEDKMIVQSDAWRQAFFEIAYPGEEKKKSWNESFLRVAKALTVSGHVQKTEKYAWI